jgi:nitrogen fixation/metabolism regulation signal transduction histidine kinase
MPQITHARSVLAVRNLASSTRFYMDVLGFERDFGDEALMGTFDSRLVGQAFGNVIKNATEAIEAAERENGDIRGARE